MRTFSKSEYVDGYMSAIVDAIRKLEREKDHEKVLEELRARLCSAVDERQRLLLEEEERRLKIEEICFRTGAEVIDLILSIDPDFLKAKKSPPSTTEDPFPPPHPCADPDCSAGP